MYAKILIILVLVVLCTGCTDPDLINPATIPDQMSVVPGKEVIKTIDSTYPAKDGHADRTGIEITKDTSKMKWKVDGFGEPATIYIPVVDHSGSKFQLNYLVEHVDANHIGKLDIAYTPATLDVTPRKIGKQPYCIFHANTWSHYDVSGVYYFWDVYNIPDLYNEISDNSVISYDAGNDIYTVHKPLYQNQTDDVFYLNETVHLKSNNDGNEAYFRWAGTVHINNSAILGWNTTSNATAPTTDSTRAYIYCDSGAKGKITNSNISYLGHGVTPKRGIVLYGYSNQTIDNNSFLYNHIGLYLRDSTNYATVSNNSFDYPSGLYGVLIIGASNYNTFVDNSMTADVDYGIYLQSSSHGILSSNSINNTGTYDFRIELNSENNTIVDNLNRSNNFQVGATIDSITFHGGGLIYKYGFDGVLTTFVDNEPMGIESTNMTVVIGTIDRFNITFGLIDGQNYTLQYINNTLIESQMAISGSANFSTDLGVGTYKIVSGFGQNMYIDRWMYTTYLNGGNTNLPEFFTDLAPYYLSFYNATDQKTYNYKSGRWEKYADKIIKPGEVVMLRYTANITKARTDASSTFSLTLKTGLNHIGHSYNGTRTLSWYNTTIASANLVTIEHQNPETGTISTFTYGSAGNGSVEVLQGCGVEVNVSADTVISGL